MYGPLGANSLMNEMGLMQKKLDFTGKISKIQINKMYKKVSSRMAIWYTRILFLINFLVVDAFQSASIDRRRHR